MTQSGSGPIRRAAATLLALIGLLALVSVQTSQSFRADAHERITPLAPPANSIAATKTDSDSDAGPQALLALDPAFGNDRRVAHSVLAVTESSVVRRVLIVAPKTSPPVRS